MLTRLTADQLDITDIEYEALIWTRDCLAGVTPAPDWLGFDMGCWQSRFSPGQPLCGTYACIGGTMELHIAGLTKMPGDHILTTQEDRARYSALKETTNRGTYGSSALGALFFLFDPLKSRDKKVAVEAIDRFLAGNTENPHQLMV